MFKFITICLMVIACVAAKPSVSPLGYTGLAGSLGPAAYASPIAVPYTAYSGQIAASPYHVGPVGAAYAASPIVAPYASSYNAHHVQHAAAYPLTYAAPVAAAYHTAPVAAHYHAAPIAATYQHSPLAYSHGHHIVGAAGPAKLIF